MRQKYPFQFVISIFLILLDLVNNSIPFNTQYQKVFYNIRKVNSITKYDYFVKCLSTNAIAPFYIFLQNIVSDSLVWSTVTTI